MYFSSKGTLSVVQPWCGVDAEYRNKHSLITQNHYVHHPQLEWHSTSRQHIDSNNIRMVIFTAAIDLQAGIGCNTGAESRSSISTCTWSLQLCRWRTSTLRDLRAREEEEEREREKVKSASSMESTLIFRNKTTIMCAAGAHVSHWR